jgi:hypothetical protein
VRTLFGSKRGNAVVDGFLFLAVLFIIAIIGVLGYMTLSQFNNKMQTDNNFGGFERGIVNDLTNRYVGWADGLFVFFFFMIWMMTIVASFSVSVSPVFLGLSIILMMVTIVVGAILSNVYQTMMADPQMLAYSAPFTLTTFLFNHYVAIVMIAVFSIAGVLYAKVR